jgi:3-oxoacyl-[acyl-carrier protein] reductase
MSSQYLMAARILGANIPPTKEAPVAIAIDFSGRRALVIGGSGGIGLAIARKLAEAGAETTVTGTRERSEYEEDFAGLDYRRLDVADDAALQAFAAGFERLDVLVNCAGAVAYRRKEFELETFRRVLDVNLSGVLHACTLFRDRLRFARGSVVNVASLASFFGSRGNPAYGASKAAVVQLTKTLALAWAADGVRVNAIAPGWVATRMTEVSQQNESINAAILARSPFGRWGEPEEMAGAALFLASDLASFVTGETLIIDGGYGLAV